tara:strand:+ start:5597 stop:6679 length:1083 start_codon:yes stop_codon:yes gene_type:complete
MITSSTVGGGPQQLLLLASELQNIYEISIATPFDQFYLQKLNILSISNLISVEKRTFNLVDLFRLVYFIIKKKISIIHSHGKAAGVLGRFSSLLTGIPLVHTFHGIHVSGKSNFARWAYILYEKIFSRIDLYDIYVSNSEKIMAENYFNHPKNLSFIIPNGVRDFNGEFSLDTNRRKIKSMLNIPKNKLSVISLCSLVKVKNIFETLEIAKLCPDLSFWILGEGSLLNEFQQWIKKYKVENVIFPGFCKDPQKFLCAADIYLSSSFREGHPLSLLEAMSVGLPVVASNVAGNDQTIEHSVSGYYYTLGNVKEASLYLQTLANDDSLRLTFGLNAQRLQRKRFSSIMMAKKYEELYSKIHI